METVYQANTARKSHTINIFSENKQKNNNFTLGYKNMDIEIFRNVKMLFKWTDLLSFLEEKEYQLNVNVSLIFISFVLICSQDSVFTCLFFFFSFSETTKSKNSKNNVKVERSEKHFSKMA